MKTNIKFRAPRNRRERRVIIFFLAKLGFTRLSHTNAVLKARQVVTAMTGNANFTTPNPTLASITAAATALDDANQAMDGTKVKTIQRNTARAALNTLMGGILTYVDNTSAGDAEKVLSAAMDITDPRTKAVVLDPPTGLTTWATPVEGQIKIKCAAIKKKKFYVVEAAEDVPGPVVNWNVVAESTKSTIFIDGLNSGTKYRFRMAVVNSAGGSGWSDEITGRPI